MKKGMKVGFQASDFHDLASGLGTFPGVTGVWILAPTERQAMMWVAIQGFDAEAHQRRLDVRQHVERFVQEHLLEIRQTGFLFDYHVLVDHPDVGDLHIPAGAERAA
jgi:hypothetical protein